MGESQESWSSEMVRLSFQICTMAVIAPLEDQCTELSRQMF